MSELEDKLSGILSNPAMMQQIMGMAKMLSQQPEPEPSHPQQAQNPTAAMPDVDPGMLKMLSGILSQGGTDSHQQGLLQALQPYLSRDRLLRLERAMHAARMAGAASVLLGSQSRR